MAAGPEARRILPKRLKTFTTDPQGRITSYSFRRGPSVERLRKILTLTGLMGATGVGIVGDVGEFQGYEMDESEHRQVRAYGKTPQSVLRGLRGYRGSEPADYGILHQIALSTHSEHVADLRGATINFYYGG